MDLLVRLCESLVDRYRIEREIGRGGMSVVYLAEDRQRGRRVALKVLSPDLGASVAADRFAREIEIAGQLTHPNIVPLLDSGDVDGLPFYVMPYIEGETLAERLQREHRFTVAETLRIASDVAGALSFAHARGIVHRDIKPHNVLLIGDRAVVTDFGIARAIDAASNDHFTTSGVIIGTPTYMSPEQAYGDNHVDGRSDIYSLGCVTYEMLAGHAPYLGTTRREILARHSMDALPPMASARPEVPAGIERAVARALAKDPLDRFATAQGFVDALQQGAATAPAGARIDRRAFKRRAAVIAITLLASVAAGIAVVRSVNAKPPLPNAQLVAVFPFRVVGDSNTQYLREGIVDLVVTKLAAMDGPRAIDTRTVMAAWRRAMRDGAESSESQISELAASLGTARYILGEVVAARNRVAISARLYRGDGPPGTAEVNGPADSLFALLDRVCIQLVAGTGGEPGRRLADLTSTSIPAVRDYLSGRAAWRRGESDRAIRSFTSALETDSTFALAALGMAAAGAWSQQAGQSEALRRGLRTGYALRGRLAPRDRLLFEAYVTPTDSGFISSSRQLMGWYRAAEAAPESPETQYEYGDRLYHTGAQLGIPNAIATAEATFQRALGIDSGFALPRAHLIEIAAMRGDKVAVNALLSRYSREAAGADAGAYVNWRASQVRREAKASEGFRSGRATLSQTTLNRIIGFGLVDIVGLGDVDSAITELRHRIVARSVRGARVHPAQTLHSWAANRGHRAIALEAIDELRRLEPLPAGSSIVYFAAEHVPVLDALFWDGDTAQARVALLNLEQRAMRPMPRSAGARARYFTELCAILLWRQIAHEPGVDRTALSRLRSGASPSDSVSLYGGSPLLCLGMLDALIAVEANDPRAQALVAQLEALLLDAPYQFGVDFGNLVLARLHESLGNLPAAVRAVRRRPYDWDVGPLYLTTYLREEGRLAALAGDSTAAVQAFRRFLALREGSDSHYRSVSDSVKRQLRALQRQ